MSRERRFILLAVLALLTLVLGAAATPALAAPRAAAADWTFAIYCDGDNSLESAWDGYSMPWLLELAGNPAVNVVVMLDRKSTSGTELIEIRGGSEAVARSYPERNFGDGTTFSWFLQEVSALYPADHLAVTMWDHGYGWRYIARDDTSGGDGIMMDELHAAIDTAGVPIDILSFDACNMGNVDVAFEAALTGQVAYMVASEESVSNSGYPYDEMLAPVIADPSRTPRQVAGDMVAGWKTYYDTQTWANTAQLSALDLAALGAAKADLQQWAARLSADLPVYKKSYTAELGRTWRAWASNHYDLGDYCDNLIADSGVADATLKALAQKVKTDVAGAVFANSTAPASAEATGLTIWWDGKVDWKTWQGDYQAHVAFAQPVPVGVGWWAFLNAYAGR